MKTLGHPILVGLPDLCADALTFAVELARGDDPGDAEALRLKISDLLKTLETRARGLEVSDEDHTLVKFALVIFIDQIVLNSGWPIRESWRARPLELEYFNSFDGGEEFYRKLERIRASDDARKLDVLEVYVLCLALGFRGKHADLQGTETVRQLVKDLSRDIRDRRGPQAQLRSPGGMPQDELPEMVKESPAWILPAACAGLLFVVFLLLSFQLGRQVAAALETFGG